MLFVMFYCYLSVLRSWTKEQKVNKTTRTPPPQHTHTDKFYSEAGHISRVTSRITVLGIRTSGKLSVSFSLLGPTGANVVLQSRACLSRKRTSQEKLAQELLKKNFSRKTVAVVQLFSNYVPVGAGGSIATMEELLVHTSRICQHQPLHQDLKRSNEQATSYVDHTVQRHCPNLQKTFS